jgi:glutathione synthase/RimK-type ligase-like ATP-grasp enzyme
VELAKRGAEVFRLNTEDLPEYASSSFGIDHNAAWWQWQSGDLPVDLSRVRSIWYRRHRLPLLTKELSDGEKEFCLRESDWFVRGALLSRAVRWMSHPAAIASAEAKLFQLSVARDIGFSVPTTLVTNSASEARRFVEARGAAIAKPIRTGYVDDGSHGLAIFSNLVTLEDLQHSDDSIQLAPVIFQQFIQKVCDVRITVVGERVFAARIDSQEFESSRIDWRRSERSDLRHTAIDLPSEVSRRCLTLLDRLNLSFGAVDMVIDAGGNYHFLEINPTGQWAWLQDRLGFDISGAIADWLLTVPNER